MKNQSTSQIAGELAREGLAKSLLHRPREVSFRLKADFSALVPIGGSLAESAVAAAQRRKSYLRLTAVFVSCRSEVADPDCLGLLLPLLEVGLSARRQRAGPHRG